MTLAFWCVLVAALLPYVAFSIAARPLDPKLPRNVAWNLEGMAARAYGAHFNALEGLSALRRRVAPVT